MTVIFVVTKNKYFNVIEETAQTMSMDFINDIVWCIIDCLYQIITTEVGRPRVEDRREGYRLEDAIHASTGKEEESWASGETQEKMTGQNHGRNERIGLQGDRRYGTKSKCMPRMKKNIGPLLYGWGLDYEKLRTRLSYRYHENTWLPF